MQSNLDLIIESNILTMANQQPRVQAVGVKNGKIAAVGSLDELTKAKGNDTLVLDLKGKTVLPGFIDSHMHPVLTGMVQTGVDLSAVHTIDDTLVKIKKRVEKTHPGVWILCFRFQDKLLQEKRFPTKQELDDISTAHPIIIFHNDLHFAMMNTPAIQQIDFPAELEGVHTVSDRATEQALTIYEKILDEHPRKDHRHRFEHFEIPTREQLKRTVKRRLAAGMQPMFVPVCEGPDLEGYRKFIGEVRVKRSNAFRTIIDEGLLVAGGSDSPVTPMSALQGVQACLTHPLEEQRISLYEALRLFTINSAKIGFEEDIKGSIEKGKLADFVVLSRDPYQVPHDEIGNITVEMTILGGNIVYQNKT